MALCMCVGRFSVPAKENVLENVCFHHVAFVGTCLEAHINYFLSMSG